jgi:hypothetical protein
MKTKDMPEIKRQLKKAAKFNSAANKVICCWCSMILKPDQIAPHINGNCPKGKDKTSWQFKDVK